MRTPVRQISDLGKFGTERMLGPARSLPCQRVGPGVVGADDHRCIAAARYQLVRPVLADVVERAHFAVLDRAGKTAARPTSQRQSSRRGSPTGWRARQTATCASERRLALRRRSRGWCSTSPQATERRAGLGRWGGFGARCVVVVVEVVVVVGHGWLLPGIQIDAQLLPPLVKAINRSNDIFACFCDDKRHKRFEKRRKGDR